MYIGYMALICMPKIDLLLPSTRYPNTFIIHNLWISWTTPPFYGTPQVLSEQHVYSLDCWANRSREIGVKSFCTSITCGFPTMRGNRLGDVLRTAIIPSREVTQIYFHKEICRNHSCLLADDIADLGRNERNVLQKQLRRRCCVWGAA